MYLISKDHLPLDALKEYLQDLLCSINPNIRFITSINTKRLTSHTCLQLNNRVSHIIDL
ncbi:unnamed protein product, partial [Rotaria socialis]